VAVAGGLGSTSPPDYAAARAAELAAALGVLGVDPRRISIGAPDQELVSHLPEVVARLEPELARAELVLTHAYEGGHPDHDAAALAVQVACERLRRRTGRAPARLEFAGYHAEGSGRVVGRFFPARGGPEVEARLTGPTLAAKRAALACFLTQAPVIAWFRPELERYRVAPDYDFTAPPPPGSALYDQWGWNLTSADWRTAAARFLARSGDGA